MGAVFELSRGKDGKWREKVLPIFSSASNCADGDVPNGGLIFDAGGICTVDLLRQRSRQPDGLQVSAWQNGAMDLRRHSQSFNGRDGRNPDAGLILDLKATCPA